MFRLETTMHDVRPLWDIEQCYRASGASEDVLSAINENGKWGRGFVFTNDDVGIPLPLDSIQLMGM